MDLSRLHPEVRRRLAAFSAEAEARDWPFRITSAWRSTAEQARLFQAWIDRGKKGLPAAPPGFSTHEYGFAFDAVALDPAKQGKLGALAECFGLHWAGSSDRVHFDVFGRAWRALLEGRPASDPYRC